ncbi:MAG TPA: ATP-binding protein [Longimicrobiaceae bacterium]|nr:ATP-binding protein [Longimicrobiaceae bacterium]
MRGLSSVRTKVFLLFAGAALLTVVPVLVLIRRAVEDQVYARATRDLTSANDQLRSFWTGRDEYLQESARRVAGDRKLPALFLAEDSVALRRALDGLVGEGQVFLAANTSGEALVGPELDAATLNQGGSVVVLPEAGGPPVRMAVWPVYADSTPAESGDSAGPAVDDSVRVGIVGVGRRIDAATMRDLKTATGGQVALVTGDSVVSTTFPDSVAEVLPRLELASKVSRGGTIWRPQIEGLPYLYSVNSLPTRQTPTAVFLFRSVAEELKIARGIRQSVVVIGLGALFISLVLALVVARIVARPAQALAAAAAGLARGHYGAPLPRASSDEIGQLTRAFAEMRSAIAEREARLRSAQAELIHREKLAAMGRLVAQLSHEINNPINNIQNCLEVLERRGSPTDPNREFLELAREELNRMAVLTRQLLDQSRPLADAARPLNLNHLAQRVMLLARNELEARGISSELALAPALPPVVAHPDAIQQVLANLVDNARDAMPGGGTLRVSTRADEEAVEVVVEDSGAGISEEDLPHIFDAFYTTKPGVRGIGLGLFVSEGIIRGHRGRLLVESRPGEGSRFIVQLPRETLDALSETHAPDRSAVV